jgi:hypothetical protein
MRHDLIGYLMGALEPEEMERVTEALRQSPQLREELEQIRRSLEPLDDLEEIIEPPSDLLARTMAAIPMQGSASGDSDSVDRQHEADSPTSRTPQQVMSAGSFVHNHQWRLADVFGMAIAVVVLAGLVLPGIVRERAAARVAACQSQLREAGVALVEYLVHSDDQRFPGLMEEGPESFAGMYAIWLGEAGLSPRKHPLWCPSLDIPVDWVERSVPTRVEIQNATPIELANFQKNVGGHYAYSLGILERGRYRAPKFQGRSGFAILADAPLRTMDGWSTAHEGRGFNILFEDGHIEFLAEFETWKLGDHPFLNRSGVIEAGLDPNDASLGPSDAPPFLPHRIER